jgi:hypothetical protein
MRRVLLSLVTSVVTPFSFPLLHFAISLFRFRILTSLDLREAHMTKYAIQGRSCCSNPSQAVLGNTLLLLHTTTIFPDLASPPFADRSRI